MKKIDLENMDGEEFEILCKEIFSKFYNVDVDKTPLVGDGGKDLIIRMPEGAVYVECKHHHNSTIGRPIVQKLHSAMVTDWVKKGIIVTTGTFSKQAEDHIEKNSLPIELIDGHKFKEMAESVGYELFYGQLKEVPVKAGDYVDAKTVLGYVGQPTKYYSVEGCNVYFEMRKDGQPVNPMEYLVE